MNLEEYFIEVKPQEFQQFLRNLLQNSQNWAVFCSNLQIFMSFFGVFFNILHIFILLNKSMRRQATNVLIIGIAISDIFYLFYYVEGGTREFLENGIPGKCRPKKTEFLAYYIWIVTIFKDVFRRVSAFSGVSLALIRYLVMKYGARTNIRVYVTTSTSWALFFSTILFSLVISSINHVRYIVMRYPDWVPPESCKMYPPNTTLPWFEQVQNPDLGDFQRQISTKFLYIDGVFKIIPPILYPFLAFGLLWELKKARDSRKILMRKGEEHEMVHVTKLVIFMTIGYFLAETPVGISYFYLAYNMGEDFGIIFLANNITVIFVTFLIINSSIHCFFCFFLSSQYRLAFWSIFGCKCASSGSSVSNSRNMSSM
ncbi:G-protein coupled receptors family 1 profile domain-containing protein [Caenorhabditis elegans]|uniref:G-protein coupled receptors family 1 profile domain-containing protein n=1 Tax=Caenorhabditis elegans TaxID=6239 RepID=Q9XWL4_CAEEL|nr:G-protein coupled receptors family 1 profile domain-containing protein [Caenorhabditis elegans]CAA21642.1 G-protein coupled receptors family 1 profile domain-containing protein [Caenorhabditis elegans]|eukprot:NP_507772.1 Serpentine Receptor, class W [Caenorhabditis elegans]